VLLPTVSRAASILHAYRAQQRQKKSQLRRHFATVIGNKSMLNPNSAVKVLKNRIVLIMRVNPDVRRFNGFCKPLITSRKSIPY